MTDHTVKLLSATQFDKFSQTMFNEQLLQWNPASQPPINTATSLLQPLYSDPEKSSASHFLVYGTPLIRPSY